MQINTWILGLLKECKDTYQAPVIPGEREGRGEGREGDMMFYIPADTVNVEIFNN